MPAPPPTPIWKPTPVPEDAMTHSQPCRSCGAPLTTLFVDLGQQPISNAMRRPEQLRAPEPFYPLRTYVCDSCHLVQTFDVHAADAHFDGDYTYFSSYADSWLKHAETYAAMMTRRFRLGPDSRVIEVASNDGYLLQYFRASGIPVLGIDPAANCAEVAMRERGVPTRVAFFGRAEASRLVAEGVQADVMVSNNVLAHVPDINDFVAGFQIALKPDGVWTIEFPHLLQMIEQNYFDTIYHEHYSYLSLLAVEHLLGRHGLKVVDLEEWPTHGGSLRLFVRHINHADQPSAAVLAFRAREAAAGLNSLRGYAGFAEQVKASKRALLSLLIELKARGATIVGYGAPAKGNTLLNYCGIGTDFLDYTVDRSPHKQGRLLPGIAVPVLAPEQIAVTKPDYVLILPWNLRAEIMAQLSGIASWGGQFIVPLPVPEVVTPSRAQAA
jgi:SAM-dependent methyltransferase